MRHFSRGLALVSLIFLLTVFALSSAAAPPPNAGPPEHLFRRSVPLNGGFASVNSVAEARVDVNFIALERAGALRIRLLDGTQVVALRTRLEERSAGDYTWRGHLIGIRERSVKGDVVLTVKDGAAAGVLYTSRGVYRLLPRAGGEHRLALTGQGATQGTSRECAGTVESPAETQSAFATQSIEALTDSPDRQDVLIVYTQKARSEAGGTAAIEATMQNAIDLTHTAYDNSQITPRLNIVHMQEIDHREARHFATDLSWVRNDPEVNGLRDQYGADMVALIIHNLTSCGTAYLMSEPSVDFAPNAYQVTAWDCAGDNLTLPHEFGHNQGADHNPEDATNYPTGAAYPWSYGHYIDGDYRTVLAYSAQCVVYCTRHPYFSNPSIIFNGDPTGIAGDRENYRTINDTAIYVANYRPAATSCGNGIIDGTEECDGSNLNGATCGTFGHSQGSLSCNTDCTYDSSDCHTCGNGVREGAETCDGTDVAGLSCADFSCTGGGSLGCNSTCDDFDLSACNGCAVCDNNGVCDAGEDCSNCGDCISGAGAECGDGVCDIAIGEDCVSCAADCNGVQGGKPANRYCCGNGGTNPVGCNDARCDEGGFSCSDQTSGTSCCGDLVCEGIEDSCNCGVDCGSSQSFELSCSNGVDDDCDTLIDCADTDDCTGDPACPTCEPIDAPCTSASQCCSGSCKGKKNKFCT